MKYSVVLSTVTRGWGGWCAHEGNRLLSFSMCGHKWEMRNVGCALDKDGS